MVFFLAFLFVIVIPLAEGGLLALFLRDLYNKHPLPLGEIVEIVDEPVETPLPKPVPEPVDESPAEEEPQGFIDADAGGSSILKVLRDTLAPDGMETRPVAVHATEAMAEESKVDVFANAGDIPTDLPVDDALNAMLTSEPTAASTDMDDIVQKPGTDTGWNDLQNNVDDEDASDENEAQQIESLLETMPKNTGNLDAELQGHPNGDAISETAQELLGTDFDVDALLPTDTVTYTVMEEPAAGFVRTSSIPTAGTESEVIMPTFSNDFVQATSTFSASESAAGDVPQLFFTEELKPMFSRKRRT